MSYLTVQTVLVEEKCCSCGVVFGIDRDHQARLIENHRTFYCPNGHSQSYTGKSAADKLRDELTAVHARLDQQRAETEYQRKARNGVERRFIAAKGRITKLRKRCVNGLCTCCNKEFPDLGAHMKAEHPDAETRKD